MAKTSEMATIDKQIELNNPKGIMEFATNLKEIIVQNQLFTNIQGKNYVNVEGWQAAGAFTGIFPMVDKVENLSDGVNYKYRAEVSLYDGNGNRVGSGMAICSNSEPGKTKFAEYAVASMAQTRAIGKAFRMKLGWLLKIAGYETTPAEEMDAVEAEATQGAMDEVKLAKEKLAQAKDMMELKSIFIRLGKIRENPSVAEFKDIMKARFGGTTNESE